MSMIENDQTKVTPNALNTVATSSVMIGVLAPLAAATYNFGQNQVPMLTLLFGVAI